MGTPGAEIKLEHLPRSAVKFIEPMTCTPVGHLPEAENLQYEIKLDGYRALALRTASGADLRSRKNRPLNNRFPEIVRALTSIEPGTVLDGEIVVLDENGRPSFNLLQNYQTSSRPVLYYAFDLLVYGRRSLLQVPLNNRRQILADFALRHSGDPIRLSPTFHARASDLIAAAKEQRIEGIIAKRVSSIYEPGRRSESWLKFKVNQGQELVIGGYIPGAIHFDSLLVGYYEGVKLLFIGKVRNGFVRAVKEQVFGRFAGLESDVCPFANLPEPKTARRGEALTVAVMKKCRWLKPELVAQIEFTEWTAGNHLRHSKFVALRDDKKARDVHHEVAVDRG